MLTLRVPSFRRAAFLVLPLLVAVVILTSLPPRHWLNRLRPVAKRNSHCRI